MRKGSRLLLWLLVILLQGAALAIAQDSFDTAMKQTVANANSGTWENAESSASEALEIAVKAGDGRQRSSALRWLGFIHNQLREFEQALSEFRDCRKLQLELQTAADTQIDTMRAMADALSALGQHAEAKRTREQGLDLARSSHDTAREHAMLLDLCAAERAAGQLATAEAYVQQSLELAKSSKDLDLETDSRLKYGTLLASRSEHALAVAQFDRAADLASNSSRPPQLRLINEFMAVFGAAKSYAELHDPVRALERYQRALSLSRELQPMADQWTILIGISDCYGEMFQHEKRIGPLQQALELAQKSNDESKRRRTLNDLGQANLNLGKNEAALGFYQAALAIKTDESNGKWEMGILHNIGHVYGELEQYDKELAVGEELLKRQGDPDASTLLLMGNAKAGLKQDKEAVDYYVRAAKVGESTGDEESGAEAEDRMRAMDEAAGRYADAYEAAKRVLAFRERAQDRAGQAEASDNLANICFNLKHNEEAAKWSEKAAAIWHEFGDVAREAASLEEKGLNLRMAGRREESRIALKSALECRTRAGDRLAEAKTLFTIALDTPDDSEALDQLLRSLALVRGSASDGTGSDGEVRVKLEFSILQAITSAYQQMAHYQTALDWANQTLALARERADLGTQQIAVSSMVAIYSRLGQEPEALASAVRSAELCRGLSDRVCEADEMDTVASEYQALGEYAEAARAEEQALSLFQQPEVRASTSFMPEREIWAQFRLGAVYLKAKDQRSAEAISRGRGLIENLDPARRSSSLPTALGILLNGLMDEQMYESALSIAEELQRLAVTPSERAGALQILVVLQLALSQDSGLRKSVAIAEKLDFSQLDSFTEYALRAVIGIAKLKLEDVRGAYAHLLRASELVEGIRSDLKETTARMRFFSANTGAIKALAVCLALIAMDPVPGAFDTQKLGAAGNDFASAGFYFSERARARSLLETLARARSTALDLSLPKPLAEEQDWLEAQERTAMAGLRKPEGNRAEKEAVLAQVREKVQDFTGRLRTHPDQRIRNYAALKYPEPVRADEVPLRDNEVLVEYMLFPQGSSAVWILRKGQPLRVEILHAGEDRFTSLIRDAVSPSSFRTRSARRSSAAQTGRDPKETLAELYGLLLDPTLKYIRPGDRIIIVPDGALYRLPFEMLGHKSEDGRWKYAGEEWTFSYYPSASILALNRNTAGQSAWGTAQRPLLALGDPEYGTEQAPQGGTGTAGEPSRGAAIRHALENTGYSFSPLPGTRQEVLGIATLFGMAPTDSDLKLGPSADEASLKRLESAGILANYRFIHFATHGVVGDELPGLNEPALALSRPQKGSTEDGMLTMSEVLSLHLGANLVVLSACQTGLGEQVNGEGILGMTRAFFFAGTHSVVVSLWSVSDESTALLMQEFYKELRDGRGKADALAHARLEVMKTHPEPYYWAPFVLVGER